MNRVKTLASALLSAALLCGGMSALADPDHDRGGPPRGERAPPGHFEGRPAEPHPGPAGYHRPEEPQGWNQRPAAVDRGAYQHNFQAARSYRIGPYHRPAGFVARHWVFGQVLPRPYWVAQYILADYWLFGLEIPPAGYEWVRVGGDALLVAVASGEILQVEYGVFA